MRHVQLSDMAAKIQAKFYVRFWNDSNHTLNYGSSQSIHNTFPLHPSVFLPTAKKQMKKSFSMAVSHARHDVCANILIGQHSESLTACPTENDVCVFI